MLTRDQIRKAYSLLNSVGSSIRTHESEPVYRARVSRPHYSPSGQVIRISNRIYEDVEIGELAFQNGTPEQLRKKGWISADISKKF